MSYQQLRSPQAKIAHLDACLEDIVEYKKSAAFDLYEFSNEAACDISLSGIDLSTQFLGKKLQAPLMIAPMTGGIARGAVLNKAWASAAEHFGLAMGVGSQRLALEDKSRSPYYKIRSYAPTSVLFANLGAAQIAHGFGADEALAAVEMIEADALFIHFNSIQEACQGDADFDGVLKKLSIICEKMTQQGVPVFAREVCFGISEKAAQRLINAGVSGIDCSGAGGTSWAKVESLCTQDEQLRKIAWSFGEWGIPTAQSILNVRAASKNIPLIASGGIRSGIDVAKSLALGANIAAMARPILLASVESEQSLHDFLEQVIRQLRICMLGIGAKNIKDISKDHLITGTVPSLQK